MAQRSTNPKVLRNDLKNKLIVELSRTTQVTPEIEARIVAKTLQVHPRTVSEAPDGAYNHSNSTVLRALAGLVAEGKTLDGDLGDTWAVALDNGQVTVASETDEGTGVRRGDITIGQYVVRAAEGGGHHVFRKGVERGSNTVADMASGLLD